MTPIGGAILMVEDEAHDVEFLRRAFTRVGIGNPLRAVANGEEAVRYLQGEAAYGDRATFPLPRLLVTDLKMPQMGGLELLQWIQRHPAFRLMPAIVYTSSTSQADVDAAYAAGASGYMVKPVSLAELERMVKIIADYWRLTRLPRLPATG
jgi:CheY-like chemotaxis protein